ncbi:cupin domain-containing protein [Moorella naiadis]|uniref:cupin domain-containing protein n=1 Tax=Moorella naiadis (nom. illeg.) TaxID=3093670 RepID=UPI003D9C7FA4
MDGKQVISHEVKPVLLANGERQVRILLDATGQSDLPLALAQYSYRPGVTGPRHNHTIATEVYYCLQGSGVVTIGEDVYSLAPGVVVYIPPGQDHQTTSGEEGLEFLAFFTPPVRF